MAATGLLDRTEGAAAVEAMADFGLEILWIVEAAATEVGLPLGVRIGISSAGVCRPHSGVRGDVLAPAARVPLRDAGRDRAQRESPRERALAGGHDHMPVQLAAR